MNGKLNKDQQIILGALFGTAFIIYFFWTYLLSPINNEIKTKNQKFQELQAQVQQAEMQSKRLPALKNELDKLEIELASLEKQLPTEKDLPGILRLITREALAQGINFISLNPLDPKRDQYFDVIEFEMSINASLHAFARYVAALGQQERIFQVDQVKVTSSGAADAQGNLPPLNIIFQLKTYAYAG